MATSFNYMMSFTYLISNTVYTPSNNIADTKTVLVILTMMQRYYPSQNSISIFMMITICLSTQHCENTKLQKFTGRPWMVYNPHGTKYQPKSLTNYLFTNLSLNNNHKGKFRTSIFTNIWDLEHLKL